MDAFEITIADDSETLSITGTLRDAIYRAYTMIAEHGGTGATVSRAGEVVWDSSDFEVDCRVSAGAGDDEDFGRLTSYVDSTSDGTLGVWVSWDSGTRTWSPIESLRPSA